MKTLQTLVQEEVPRTREPNLKSHHSSLILSLIRTFYPKSEPVT